MHDDYISWVLNVCDWVRFSLKEIAVGGEVVACEKCGDHGMRNNYYCDCVKGIEKRVNNDFSIQSMFPKDRWCSKCKTVEGFCVCDWVCATCKEHPEDCRC